MDIKVNLSREQLENVVNILTDKIPIDKFTTEEKIATSVLRHQLFDAYVKTLAFPNG